MDRFGDVRIDFHARQLFQNGGALVGRSVEEGREAALRQKHGAGEAGVVHACQLFHPGGEAVELAFQHFVGDRVGAFTARRLQIPPRSGTGPALAPAAADPPRLRLEGHFGVAFPGMPGHDLVFGFGNGFQARGAAIEGEAERVKDGGLARTRGADDGENAV